MATQDIRKKLYSDPFCLFRVFLSDGATYDVNGRADAYVSLTEIVIAIGPEEYRRADAIGVCRAESCDAHRAVADAEAAAWSIIVQAQR